MVPWVVTDWSVLEIEDREYNAFCQLNPPRTMSWVGEQQYMLQKWLKMQPGFKVESSNCVHCERQTLSFLPDNRQTIDRGEEQCCLLLKVPTEVKDIIDINIYEQGKMPLIYSEVKQQQQQHNHIIDPHTQQSLCILPLGGQISFLIVSSLARL